MISDSEWLYEGVVCVSTDEILEQQFRVSEVAGVVVPVLSVTSDEGLLEILGPPDPFSHGWACKEVGSLLDDFVGSHLDVLIEQVASKHLLSVFVVVRLRCEEEGTQYGLANEVEVLVMEEDVVVIKEQERHQ